MMQCYSGNRRATGSRIWWLLPLMCLLGWVPEVAAQAVLLPASGTSSVTTCNGTVYDNGGANGPYAAYASGATTLLPATTGNKIKLEFTSFNVESYYDQLSIYDGTSTSAPLIGTYDYYSPGTVYATNPSGALTLRFTSDGGGQYNGFAATISCVTTVPQPDLAVQGASVQPLAAVAGSSLQLASSVYNLATVTANGSSVGYYLSSNAVLDASDVLLGNTYGGQLTGGQTSYRSGNVTLPATLATGTYYVLFVADYLNQVAESNESNNLSAVSLNVLPPSIDLLVQQSYLNASTVAQGGVLGMSCNILNQGNIFSNSSSVGFYLSTNATLDAADQLLTSSYGGQLYPNYSSYRGATANLPTTTAPGSYYILFVADYQSVVTESNEANNVAAAALTVVAPSIDLAVTQAQLNQTSASAGSYLSFSSYVYNQGNTTAGSSSQGVYLSTDAQWSANDTPLTANQISTLSGGSGYSTYGNFTVPANTAPGAYYVLFVADYQNVVAEINETNNVRAVAFSVITPSIDLTVTQAQLGQTSAPAGSYINFSSYVYNQGNTTAGSSTQGVYLSTDAQWSANDALLSSNLITSVAAGYGYTTYDDFTIPANTTPGTYYVLFVADNQNVVAETNETNNVRAVTFSVITPSIDLTVTQAQLGQYSASVGTNITFNTYIYNQGNTTAGTSTQGVYLSTDTQWSANDTPLTANQVSSIAASYGYTTYGNFSLPATTTPGGYYVLFVADYQNAVTETNETNNVRAVAFTVVAPTIDLNVQQAYVSPASTAAGNQLTASSYIYNLGNSPSASSSIGYYLSTDAVFSANDVLLGNTVGGSLSGNNYASRYASLTVPAGTAVGQYYVLFVADYQNAVAETNEANNVAAAQLNIIPAGVDLTTSQPSLSQYSGLPGTYLSLYSYINNFGTTAAAVSSVGYYLSSDAVFSTNDVLLGTSTGGYLGAGSSSTRTGYVTIPTNTTPGSYYVLFVADYLNQESETNETNNVTSNSFTVTAPFNGLVVPRYGSNSVSLCSGNVYDNGGTGSYSDGSNGTLTINPGTTGAKVQLVFSFLSVETCCDRLVVYDGPSTSSPVLGTYTSTPGTLIASAGNTSGALTLSFYSDGSVTDAGFEAAISCVGGTTGPVDLVPQQPTVTPTSGVAGGRVNLTTSITNSGTGNAGSSAVGYYLSTDNALSSNDVLLGTIAGGALASGQTATRSLAATIPAGTAVGNYYVLHVADPQNAVTETNETNNVVSTALNVGAPRPDLIILQPILQNSSILPGARLNVSCLVANQGAATAASSTTGYYLSTDNVLSSNDILLGSVAASGLAVGSAISAVTQVQIPATTALGSYYVLFAADHANSVVESVETNNVEAVALSVTLVQSSQQDQLQGFSLEVYPNPVDAPAPLQVRLSGAPNGQTAEATLLNSLGQEVARKQLPLRGAMTPITFDTRNLSRGVYLLRISGAGLHATRSIIIN